MLLTFRNYISGIHSYASLDRVNKSVITPCLVTSVDSPLILRLYSWLNMAAVALSQCSYCKKKEPSLKMCSFCQCAKYCNVDCQAKARPAHKALCNEIKEQRAVVDKKRAHLLKRWFDGSEAKFEESVGEFWRILDARPYCRALRKLGTLWVKMVEEEEDLKGFVLAKYAYMELLRLTHKDNQNVKYLLPFVLLELGDVEDAFDFLKWWAWVRRPDNESERKMDDVSKIKGHWWVPRVENIFGDFFDFHEPCGGSMVSYYMDNATLFGLVVARFMIAEELKKGNPESSLVKKALAKKLRPSDVADEQMKLFFK